MKKLGLSFMMLMIMLGMIAISPANAASSPYTGGLLDGVPIQTGTTVGQPSGAGDLKMTDNDTSSYTYFRNVSVAWYDFSTPQEISAVVVYGFENKKQTMEFYDSSNKLLLTYNAANNNGIQSLPSVIHNVSTVVLKPEQGDLIREWNVFTKPSAAPSPTTITWSQGGDKFVYLEWDSTGAKTYTVKRSTSPSGLFEVIASNVTDTFYTDKSVNNGTTYYYAVSSVNEAGESANSMTNNKSSATPNATKYTGGLLDGVPISLGKTLGKPTSTERRMTDNSSTARSISTGEMAWYTFDSPVEVSAVILNAKDLVPMEFYDVDNNLLYSYKPLENDKVETLPEKIKNVTTVVLKSGWIMEWNVFGKSTEQPNSASIQLTAAGGNKKVSLHWNSTNSAASYNIKRSTVAGGPYKTIATVTGSTYDYVDSLVTNGTTYYYVVTVVNSQGAESGQSNEASATPNSDEVTPPGTDEDQYGNRALLNIVLNNGISKEFDLSMKEVNAFIAWYEGRASGNGSVMFAFDKHNNNKGPFKNRKEYVFFDKIITFEVNGYDADGGSTSNSGDENHSNPKEEY